MSSSEAVLYTVADGVATITLNRPDTLNAMNNALMGGISECIERVREDNSVRVVVLTGAGRGFCAGADLAAMADTPPQAASSQGDDTFNDAIRAIDTCPVPTIARINGAAAGGGFGLALSCDITVAAQSAFFVATFGPRLGIVPDMGVTWNLPMRVGRARSLGITLLGERISATQAASWGFIWQAVADEDLDTEVSRIAAVLKRASPSTCTRIRQTIDAAANNTLSEQLDLEMMHQAVLIPRNMHEGAMAFMEKREPQFGNERD
jgi:2-(1,2-epoxy-1,2-dihydrophenyl)acetyl-CoA isomerase